MEQNRPLERNARLVRARRLDYGELHLMPVLAVKASLGFVFFLLFLAGFALVNLSGTGDGRLSVAITAADLAAVDWRPSVLGGIRLDPTTDLRLRFETDGNVSGHGGCNHFSGHYTLDGAAVSFGALAATRMACAESLRDRELAFLDALARAASILRVGQRMALRDPDGNNLARFEAVPRTPEID